MVLIREYVDMIRHGVREEVVDPSLSLRMTGYIFLGRQTCILSTFSKTQNEKMLVVEHLKKMWIMTFIILSFPHFLYSCRMRRSKKSFCFGSVMESFSTESFCRTVCMSDVRTRSDQIVPYPSAFSATRSNIFRCAFSTWDWIFPISYIGAIVPDSDVRTRSRAPE